MASWAELVDEVDLIAPEARAEWLKERFVEELNRVSLSRESRNVIFYGSAFLQKPQLPAPLIQLTYEEINGFMSCLHGMAWDKQLTLILHTPGGVTNAAETIVHYLHSKFDHIEVVVPTYCMSAGTMIGLGSDRIWMGRQSQLGPIDPQMPIGGKYVSARAVVDQFELAKSEISGDATLAHAWAPILASLGPALLVEAQNALDYGETMVAKWLASRMLSQADDPERKASTVAHHFNDAERHKSHGRRIDRDEAKGQGVAISYLEDDQELQDAVLTAYHLMTIMFEQAPACKLIWTNRGQAWIKNTT